MSITIQDRGEEMRVNRSVQIEFVQRFSLFILLIAMLLPQTGWSYNKSWDQGHLVCVSEDGKTNWGKFDKGGVFHGGYSSKECCELLCKVCPVYANTGQLQKTFTDLTVPGVGPALTIVRTYNSQDWASSLLGNGWTFNFGRRLIIARNDAGEKIIGVLLETGEKNFFKENPDGTFERLAGYGVTYDLIKNPDATYTIKNRDGSRNELRNDGKIAKILDRNGNQLVFEYNVAGCLTKITNASGNYVTFQLGPNGKIASISDNLGRTITYTYDQNGNLTSFANPMGSTTQYAYNTANLLTQITDARGNVVESATYDTNQPPRIATFTEKGETYTIAYFGDHTVKTDSSGNAWTYYYNDVGVITKVVDPLGNVKEQNPNKITSTSLDWENDLNGNKTTYTYDANGNVTGKTDPLGNTTSYTYITGTNLMATETNPLGVVTKYEYDANGNQTKIIRDFGGALQNITTYTYDSKGNQTSVTDPLGNTTRYEYDTTGNLTKVIDPLSNVATYTYDSRGNKLIETNALGNTSAYTYDLTNRLVSVTNALGGTTTYTYDANGNKISETYANGNTKTFTYDAYNRLIQETDPLGNSKSYVYDSRDNRTSMVDPNGNTTTFTYDIMNHLISETNTSGGKTNFTYDAEGYILSITDANGKTTTFFYNANNRKSSETNAANETIIYSYDAIGNLTTLTLPNGNVLIMTYDVHNRLINVADSVGQLIIYTYNIGGLILSKSDALGNTISYSYDANNRLIEKTDAIGNKTRYSYDAVGSILSVTDRESNATTYAYDALGRNIKETDALGNTKKLSYDSVGNLVSTTDANGNTTSYSYDSSNRLIQENYADGTTRSFSYDPGSNLISRTDPNGSVTTYVHDALNRRIAIDYPGTNDSAFTYDAVGNLQTANNQNAIISFSYDNVYRLLQSNQSGQTVSYSYDIANSTKTITYPGGKVVKEIRNKRGSLSRVEDNSGQAIVQYAYDSADRIQNKNYINGITTNFIHNANGWITDLNYNKAGSQVIGLQYDFDKEGNRLYESKAHDPSNSEQYIYDAKYRLNQFKRGILDIYNKIPSPVTQTAYNLDALGNWESKTTNGETENRTHNQMNEIVDIDGVTLAYYNNGNLIDDGTKSYAYDYENRLLKVTRNSDSKIMGEYKYDALGRRIEKNASGVTTAYYYDDNRVIEEQVNGFTDATYVYGIEIDEVISMEKSGQTYYYVANSLGSIVALMNSIGDIIEQISYDAYGKPNIIKSSLSNPYLFTGSRFDEESGLQFNRSRYLSYDLGRWLTHDPRGYKDSMNLYEYVMSNPINYTDPSGQVVDLSKIGGLSAALADVRRTNRGSQLYRRLETSSQCWRIVDYALATSQERQKGRAYSWDRFNIIVVDTTYHPNLWMWSSWELRISMPLISAPFLTLSPERLPSVIRMPIEWLLAIIGLPRTSVPISWGGLVGVNLRGIESPDSPSTARILGHEIGHAATGAKDDGPLGMNNVIPNENVIASELGEKIRSRY